MGVHAAHTWSGVGLCSRCTGASGGLEEGLVAVRLIGHPADGVWRLTIGVLISASGEKAAALLVKNHWS